MVGGGGACTARYAIPRLHWRLPPPYSRIRGVITNRPRTADGDAGAGAFFLRTAFARLPHLMYNVTTPPRRTLYQFDMVHAVQRSGLLVGGPPPAFADDVMPTLQRATRTTHGMHWRNRRGTGVIQWWGGAGGRRWACACRRHNLTPGILGNAVTPACRTLRRCVVPFCSVVGCCVADAACATPCRASS